MNAGPIFSTLNYDMREHIAAEHDHAIPWSVHIGCIDAPIYLSAGACKKLENEPYSFPAQQVVYRDLLDAYDYTDRTAVSTDCASVPK